MVTSNTIQPIRLCFHYNIVTHSIAIIFVNTNCKGLKYKNAEKKGQLTENLLNKVLNFDDV